MCTYEKFPTVPVPYSMLAGYGAIAAELARALAGKAARPARRGRLPGNAL